MAWALLTSTPSSLFAGPSTCEGICLPAVFMPWQIPQDARTWRLVKAEKRITSWQIMFFVSPHILVVPSSFTNTETSLYRLHHLSNLTVTSTNSIREDAEVTLVHIWMEDGQQSSLGKFMQYVVMKLTQKCHLNIRSPESRCLENWVLKRTYIYFLADLLVSLLCAEYWQGPGRGR